MNVDSEQRADALRALLHQADAAAPPPPVQEGLAATVRRASRRRNHRRRLIAAGSALVLIAASAIAVLHGSRDRSGNALTAQTIPSPVPALVPALVPAPVPVPVGAVAEYQRAKHEAAALATSADHLLAAERRRRRLEALNARLEDPSPTQIDRIASLRSTAALTLVTQADRLKNRADSPSDALATYRRAVELFPDTPWVAVARQRIEQLQSRSPKQETAL